MTGVDRHSVAVSLDPHVIKKNANPGRCGGKDLNAASIGADGIGRKAIARDDGILHVQTGIDVVPRRECNSPLGKVGNDAVFDVERGALVEENAVKAASPADERQITNGEEVE